MQSRDASDAIRDKVLALGFSKVGVAACQPAKDDAGHLHEWLDRGFHASMEWMARTSEKRADPEHVLPGARSVVCVAMNYYSSSEHSDDPSRGRISRYAWGDDYHRILGDKLRILAEWMTEQFPGSKNLWYVDTGPVMEKAWAERAGIGWIGKHTNVITQDLGSWIFLGEVLTTLSLDPDTPATDHCGSCTLCLDACPTGAIVEPYVVDAGRCISYLTIEHRGDLPEETKGSLEHWIYGCDICQDVCPWNEKFSTPVTEHAFGSRPGFVDPSLEAWRRMSSEEFAETFRGSPIRRTMHAGLMRNIDAVLESNREENVTKRPDSSIHASHTTEVHLNVGVHHGKQ